jgi:hypothetical protein
MRLGQAVAAGAVRQHRLNLDVELFEPFFSLSVLQGLRWGYF